jgi:hypothetical protein
LTAGGKGRVKSTIDASEEAEKSDDNGDDLEEEEDDDDVDVDEDEDDIDDLSDLKNVLQSDNESTENEGQLYTVCQQAVCFIQIVTVFM